MSSTPYTPSIPPLGNIKDPDTRRVLEAFVNGWRLRNGDTKPDSDQRFITKGELKTMVEGVNNVYFGQGGAGSTLVQNATQTSLAQKVNDIINQLQREIINSQLFQDLGVKIGLIDIPSIFTRLDNTETVVRNEVTQRKTADTAIVTSVSQLGARVSTNEAGQQQEITLRVNSDNALANAVNTLWAVVGNNSGLVQGGSQVVANVTGVVASNWNQVQAAVRDPLTNAVLSTASVRDTAKATTDLISNRLTAERTIKVDVNGYVAGIGVIAQADLTTGATTSSIIMRADRFAIGSPSGNGIAPIVPFIVTTTATAQPDGTVIPPGIYIDTAFVKSLTGAYIAAGLLDAATVYTGSALVDRNSKQRLFSTTSATWQSDLISGATTPVTSGTIRMYGPSYHGGVPVNQRIRAADVNSPVVFNVAVTAVVDHYFTLWASYNGGSWLALATSVEPQNDYGSSSLNYASLAYVNPGDYVDVGISATDRFGSPLDPGKVEIRYMTMTVSVSNI